MTVYRISRTKHISDLTGEGSRLFGGRWNHKCTACIYNSESRALALLEYTVHNNIDDIPRALSIATIEIPDTNIYSLPIKSLPGNWQEAPAPTETKDLGTALLLSVEHLVIRVPSIVISQEFNYILNPLHPENKKFKITEVRDIVYDLRIKTV